MITVKGLPKKTFVVLAIVCVLVAIALTYYKLQKPQTSKIIPIITHLDYKEYNSAEELSEADLIITGTPTEDFLSRKHVNTYFPDGKLQDFYSIAEINVEKVIKGTTDLSIQNINFPIIEPNGLIKDVDGKMKKLIKENYIEMEKGEMKKGNIS